jgi:ornithine--oxo-acid transaminase
MSPTAVSGSPNTPVVESIHATSTAQARVLEDQYAAHNYIPLPVVFARAEGVNVWDPEVGPISVRL